MDVKIREVGNSLAATIPKEIALMLNLQNGDMASVSVREGVILFQPKKRKKLRGEALLEAYFGKPASSIDSLETEWIDTGEPVGGEFW